MENEGREQMHLSSFFKWLLFFLTVRKSMFGDDITYVHKQRAWERVGAKSKNS